MNELLTSQIDRAKELLEQLKKSIDVDSSSRTISPLTLNITQEILCKVRHLLDQLMNNFFKKNYATKLSPSQKKNARRNVYFPISSTKIGIADCLKKAEMQNLEQEYPDFFNLIESFQPYHSGNEWLKHLKDITPEKHIRLTPLIRNEIKQVSISNQHGSAILQNVQFHASGTGAGVSVLGVPIDLSTQLPIPNEAVKTEVRNLFSLVFEGSTIDALWLCEESVIKGEQIVKSILNFL